jgi:hypothetical protein
MAPRPLLLSTGIGDGWSDPYGEFLAAKAATPAFALLGKRGLEPETVHTVGQMVGNDLSYLMVNGSHGATDWPRWLEFMDRHLQPHAGDH